MIMIIVISQSKLLQTWNQPLRMWHTCYGSAATTFHKYFEAMICRLVW